MAEETKQQNNISPTPSSKTTPEQAPKSESKPDPKITITEICFITPLYLISDIIDLTLFAFVLDDLGLMDLIRTSSSQFYFVVLKKMGPEIWVTNLVINGIKLFPYIGSLVPSTLVWAIVIFVDRAGMSKIESLLNKAGKIGKAVKKMGSAAQKLTGK